MVDITDRHVEHRGDDAGGDEIFIRVGEDTSFLERIEEDGLDDETGKTLDGDFVTIEIAPPEDTEKKEDRRRVAKKDMEPGGGPGEKVRKKPPSTGKKKTSLLVLLVVLLFVGTVFYYEYRPPSPRIVCPSTAIAGKVISFKAEASTPIQKYLWDFGDGTNATGEKVEKYYKTAGTYRVLLTVVDEHGREYTTSRNLRVSPLQIVLPSEREGEVVSYNEQNFFHARNPDGIYSTTHNGQKVTVKEVWFWANGTSERKMSDWENVGGVEDGFMEKHAAVNLSRTQNLGVEGRIATSSGSVRVSGDVRIVESNFLEKNNRTVIQRQTVSRSSFYFSFASKEKEITSIDRVTFYPAPGEETPPVYPAVLRENRTFWLGERAVKKVGGVAYDWHAIRAENFKGAPALVLDVTVDEETKTALGIEAFEMEIWVVNETFFSVYTRLHVKQNLNGNKTETLAVSTASEIYPGGTEITFGTDTAPCYTSFLEKIPSLEEEVTSLTIVPPRVVSSASSSIPADFAARDAIDAAANNTAMGDFVSAHPDAYVSFTRYGKNFSANVDYWNITVSTPRGEGYTVNVTRLSGGGNCLFEEWGGGGREVYSREEIGDILSYGGAEEVFKQSDEVLSNFFSGGEVRNDVWLGTEANVTQPDPSGFFSGALSPGFYGGITRFGFFLEKKDGTMKCLIDGSTGRFVYVWRHTDNQDGGFSQTPLRSSSL